MQATTAVPGYTPSIFNEPNENEHMWGVYHAKNFLLVTAKTITEVPTPWATLLRKVNDYTIPYLAELVQLGSEYAKIAAPLSIAFGVIDLGEVVNSLNYLGNGDARKDLQESRISYVIGQALLLPANIIGACEFFRAADLASTLGGVAIFVYIEKGVHFLHITLIPGVAEAAAWFAQEGWVHVFATLGDLANGCIIGAFFLFGADAAYRWNKNGQEAQKCEKLFRELLEKARGDLSDIPDLRQHEFKDLTGTQGTFKAAVELAKCKAAWIEFEEKAAQAKRDLLANISEEALKVALVAGVTNPAVLAGFGAFAFYAVGSSIYYRCKQAQTPKWAEFLA